MIEDIRCRLYEVRDEKYRKFTENLIPGEHNIIGVRMPVLRSLAKEIAKGDYSTYLEETKELTEHKAAHEELMVQGMVIGYARMEREDRVRFLNEFIPKIGNWAVCDSCCMGYKFMQKESSFWFSYVKNWGNSDREFEVRFAAVSMLAHFMEKECISGVLKFLENIRHEGYYVKMAVAWALSVGFVKFPKETKKVLENGNLDDFTQNKAIQKIRESYRIDPKDKEMLLKFKRK